MTVLSNNLERETLRAFTEGESRGLHAQGALSGALGRSSADDAEYRKRARAWCVYNTGHGHLGWTLSAATAAMVADAMMRDIPVDAQFPSRS